MFKLIGYVSFALLTKKKIFSYTAVASERASVEIR
jgi:hypothetical protein